MYQPTAGDRVRVTRYRYGRVHFIKTGLILAADHIGYLFAEDGRRARIHLSTNESVAVDMRGWTQTIEPAA